MTREQKLEAALNAAKDLISLYREVVGSMPFSMADIDPESETLIDRYDACVADLNVED